MGKARSKKLAVQVPMELACNSAAKREHLQAANKTALMVLRGSDPVTITLAQMEGTITSEGRHGHITGHDGVIYTFNRKLPLGTRVEFTPVMEGTGPVATRIKVME